MMHVCIFCLYLCMHARMCVCVCACVQACYMFSLYGPLHRYPTVDKPMHDEAEAEPHRYARYAKPVARMSKQQGYQQPPQTPKHSSSNPCVWPRSTRRTSATSKPSSRLAVDLRFRYQVSAERFWGFQGYEFMCRLEVYKDCRLRVHVQTVPIWGPNLEGFLNNYGCVLKSCF